MSIPLVAASPRINFVDQLVRHDEMSLPLPSGPVVAGVSPSSVREFTSFATAMRPITFGVSLLLLPSFGGQDTFYLSFPGVECGSFVFVLFVCGGV